MLLEEALCLGIGVVGGDGRERKKAAAAVLVVSAVSRAGMRRRRRRCTKEMSTSSGSGMGGRVDDCLGCMMMNDAFVCWVYARGGAHQSLTFEAFLAGIALTCT